MIEGITKHDFQNHRIAILDLLQEIEYVDSVKADRIIHRINENFSDYSSYSLFHFTERRLSGAIFARSTNDFTEVGRSIKIEYMAVREEFRGKGIAQELMEHFVATAKHSFQNIVLTSYEGNERAIKFYTRLGFVPYTVSNVLQRVIKDQGTAQQHSDLVFIRRFPLKDVLIRPLRTSNIDFLKDMIARSLQSNGQLFSDLTEEDKEISRYYEDWDSKREIGFIARYNDKDIGAIWSRKLPFYNQGFGYVDDHIPEMGLGVIYEYRGRGLGQMLMDHLFTRLRHLGETAVSVYVQEGNPAKRAYLRNEFAVIRKEINRIIMLKKL